MFLCNIIAPIKEDLEFLQGHLKKYPVKISNSYIISPSIPNLVIGWNIINKEIPSVSILENIIDKNISWTFSKTEREENYQNNIEKFINDSVKEWLPKEFKTFDPLFHNKTLFQFVNQEINLKEYSYLYFHNNALYIYNEDKNFIINVNALKVVDSDYKKTLSLMLNSIKNMCFSYKNIASFVDLDFLTCVYTFEDARWVKYGIEVDESYFNIIPNFDTKKYIPFIMSKVSSFEFTDDEKKAMRRMCEKDNITQWLSTRTINVKKDFNKENVDLVIKGEERLIKVNYSDKRTLTGRIVANSSYNPQNLNKKNDERTNIISRFKGGKIVVFDYMSFEARIALYFCEDKEYIEKYYKHDIHLKTASIIFGNNIQITKEQREYSKIINHQILYGASKNSVIQKLTFLNNPEEIYYYITQFLEPLLRKAEKVYKEFKEKGYIVNTWGTIVRPEKDFASFNNFIQSSAVEIIVDKIYDIKAFLSPFKSQFLFQVHDSLVFDIHPSESKIIGQLAKILTCYKDMFFNVSYSSGYDFKNLSEPIEIVDSNCR